MILILNVLPINRKEIMSDGSTKIYPVAQVATAVKEYNDIIRTGPRTSVGEVVERGKGTTGMLSRVSHVTDQVFIENGYLKAEVVILNTPYGLKLRKYIKSSGTSMIKPRPYMLVSAISGVVTHMEIIAINLEMTENTNWSVLEA